MRVPGQHLKCLVASDRPDLHRIKTFLKKPTGGLVPEIVEDQINQEGRIRFLPLLHAFLFIGVPSSGNGTTPCHRDCLGAEQIPDLPVDPSERRTKFRKGSSGEIGRLEHGGSLPGEGEREREREYEPERGGMEMGM